MPVRGKTRHDPPMKKVKGQRMFAASGSGEKPNVGLLKYAKTVSSQVKAGKRR